MELKDRIKEALLSVPELDKNGEVNQTHAADRIEKKGGSASRVTVGNWLKGVTKEVSAANLSAIQSLTGYSLDWLTSGKEPKLLNSVRDEPASYKPEETERKFYEIPLISFVQAGEFQEVQDIYNVGEFEKMIPVPQPYSKHSYA